MVGIFLFGVRETAESSIQVFRNILTLKERLERKILLNISTRRQENAQTLMQFLYQTPLINIKMLAKLLGVNPNTAAALVNDFEKYGILAELTGKRRNRTFWFAEYIFIFNGQHRNK